MPTHSAASGAPTAPYLLIFRDSSPDSYKAMSPDQRQHLMEQWNRWYDGLAAQGKLEGGNPLETGGRVVKARDGRIVDGPFAEAKEAVGGYFLLNVASLEEATEIAKRCPSLPLGLGLTIEVRPVAGMCPALRASAGKSAPELARA